MTYCGNRLLNASNIFGVVLLLIFEWPFFPFKEFTDWTYGGLFVFLVWILTISDTYYFEITESELIVRNYLLPFIEIGYDLNEITEIQLKSGFHSNAKAFVRIIRGDEESTGFASASLAIKDWQNMVNDIRNRKIPVTISASQLEGKIDIPK